MADFTDRIKLVFEAVTADASSNMGKLKSGVQEAEGGFGKLKAAAGGAIDMVASSPAAMAGVAVAVGKVALDLATGFEEAALSADKFATASGLSVEQASRWQEVAGDLGVNTDALEGAVNKLNIAASKGTLEQLGIGGADTNEKLLNALTHLNGITDATERAKQGAALFGKSWTALAPLVAESGDLADNLAAVSDAKVIDEGEVEKARQMRDAMDKLSDTLDDIKLTLGEAIIGPLTDVLSIVGNITDVAGQLKDVTGGVGDVMRMLPGAGIPDMLDGLSRATDFSSGWKNQLGGVGEALTANIPVIGGWASGLFGSGDAADEAAEAGKRHEAALRVEAQAAQDAAAAAKEQEDALRSLTDATLASFNSQLGYADATNRTEDAVKKYTTANDAAAQSNFGNAEANASARDAMNDAEQAALSQAAAMLKLQDDQAKANGETLTAAERNAILANNLRTVAGTLAPDSPLRKSLEAYATQIEQVPKDATTEFHAETKTAAQQVQALIDLTRTIAGQVLTFSFKANTSAATASAPSSSATSAQALGAAPTAATAALGVTVPRAMAGGAVGSTAPVINLNVSVAPMTNPAEVGRQLADYLDAFYRRSGQRRIAAA